MHGNQLSSCRKEPARSKQNIPNGGILHCKAPSRVLYGIRLLAKQFLEVDHSVPNSLCHKEPAEGKECPYPFALSLIEASLQGNKNTLKVKDFP